MMTEIVGDAWHRERAWLGYAGLLPFLAGSIALLMSSDSAITSTAVDVMRYYAAVIASFLGAVHWGVAKQDPTYARVRLRWGVMPALIAWTLLLLPPGPAFVGFAALFAAILYVDVRLLPLLDANYQQLRIRLSTVVIACSLLAGVTQSRPLV